MNCTNKQQETAECEKRGCEGCFYNEKTADETEKNIQFWENEVQKHLKNNDIMQAVGCRLLANHLREKNGKDKVL